MSNKNEIKNLTTKITKSADGEYRVRLFLNGVYQAGADYFTDDRDDANETAALMRANGGESDKTTDFAKAEQEEYDAEQEEYDAEEIDVTEVEVYAKAEAEKPESREKVLDDVSANLFDYSGVERDKEYAKFLYEAAFRLARAMKNIAHESKKIAERTERLYADVLDGRSAGYECSFLPQQVKELAETQVAYGMARDRLIAAVELVLAVDGPSERLKANAKAVKKAAFGTDYASAKAELTA